MRAAERRAIVEALNARDISITRAISELIAASSGPSLFGSRSGLAPNDRRTLKAMRQERTDVREERRRIERDASSSPFAMRAAFATVFGGRGGFDLIVGNPPWVRASQIPAATRTMLATRYRWWRRGPGRGWGQLPDLSVAFVERAWEALAPNGTMALLVPAKLATVGYAAACRDALSRRATLHTVADLTDDPRAGFDATTYPLALVASRRQATSDHAIRLGLSPTDARTTQSSWIGLDAWSLATPAAHQLLGQLTAIHGRLDDQITPRLGVKTGANAAFLDPPRELAQWSRDALRARHVVPFKWTEVTSMLWPADRRGVAWPSLPSPVADHLRRFEAVLRRRADLVGERWWTLYRVGPATAPYRVAWSDLASQLKAVMLGPDDPVPLNSCYLVETATDEAACALAAWLNSTWIRAFARLTAEPAAGGCARFAARAMGGTPLPATVLRSVALADFARRAAAGEPVEQEIDVEVARTLNLSRHDCEVLAPLASHRR